ncbi:MAG: AAA family ATPase [Proteobacteria bacterium]|nr:AAA family ATPase [Pseudomonadota bacterium]
MDYYRILNLNSEPFSNSPDPDFFFQSVQHVECLQKLEISLRLRRGLNIVIGDVGAGKTTLSRLLIRRFAEDENVDTHLLLDPHFKTSTEFLRSVSEILSGKSNTDSNDNLKLKENIKNRLFTKGVDENRTIILIIDEGQKLPLFCLEILREFLNYETNSFKLLQIVIFAQREFEDTIQKLDNFRDRINFYHELGSLNFKETKGLVEYRLKQASQSTKTISFFTMSGFFAIFLATGGFPRKIINLCHRSLLAMIIQNKSKANWVLVLTCMDKEGSKRLFSRFFKPALCLAVIFTGVGIVSLMQSDLLKNSFQHLKTNQINTSTESVHEIKAESKPIHIPVISPSNSNPDGKGKPSAEAPNEKQLIALRPFDKQTPSAITGIEEQDITEESDKRQIEKKVSVGLEDKGLRLPQGIRVLSGPGASIEVRRLIPEKR